MKMLSAGLFVTALGHLAVLGPMMMNSQGGDLLPWLVGAWAVAATAGASGLFASGGISGISGAAGGSPMSGKQ